MNCRGTAPPTTLSTNSKPAPDSSGSTSMSQTAYWPWPPDCFTCRPWPGRLAGERLAQLARAAAPTRRRRRSGCVSRSSSTSRCASPMHHSTSWWVSGLFSSRSVGSSATSRPSALRELVLVGLGLGDDRDRQQRVGHQPTAPSAAARPCRTACRRSRPGSAWRPRRCRRRCTATTVRWVLPSGEVSAPTFSSTSWSSWPRSAEEVAGHVHRRVRPQRAGEHPDQRDPADVGVGGGLDDLGDQRPGRVAGERAVRVARRAW